MVEQGLNLLTVEKKREKKYSNFFTFSLLALILTVLISIGILLYMLWLKTTISSVTRKESEALATLNTMNGKRIKYLTLSERLSSIQKIVPGNAEFRDRLTTIAESVPPEVSIEDVSEERNIVTIKMTSPDLAAINTYLNTNLKGLTNKKGSQIRTITIQSFGLNANTGVYSATIEFVFNI